MNSRLGVFAFLAFVLPGLLAGCGDSTKVRVSGKVTMDGKPFYGSVIAENESGQSGTAVIGKGGQYDMREAPLGKVVFYVKPMTFTGMPPEEQDKIVKGEKTAMEMMAEKGGDKKENPKLTDMIYGRYQSSLPPWMTKDDIPLVIQSLKVDGKYCGKGSGYTKELKGGSSTTLDMEVKPAKLQQE